MAFQMVDSIFSKTFVLYIEEDFFNKKLCFRFLFTNYGEDSESGRYHTNREITPINERDFLNWLYEFIVYLKIQPIAFDEYIKERVEELIRQNGEEKRIPWEGNFQYSKDMAEKSRNIMETIRHTKKEIVNYFKNKGIDFSERTFRYYESEGLLTPPDQKRGRTKLYKDLVFDEIQRILYLKQERKTMRDIKKIMGIHKYVR